MKFKMMIMGDTVTVYLQKRPPAWESGNPRGSWRYRGAENGAEIFINTSLCLTAALDTLRHELGHIIGSGLWSFVAAYDSDTNVNSVGWGSQFEAMTFMHLFDEYERAVAVVKKYYRQRGR